MFKTARILFFAVAFLFYSVAISNVWAQSANFVKVSLESITTRATSEAYINPPIGDVVLGGIPFYIHPTHNMAVPPGGGNELSIPVNVPNTTKIFILINSFNTWSNYNNQKVGDIKLEFSDGSVFTKDLIIGVNIREWREGDDISPTVNWVTDSSSTEVFRGNPTHLAPPAVMDMLTIDLPINFVGKTLTKVAILDISASDPGILWMGLTIQQGSTEAPTPFLDLPWDYQGKGFKDEALNIYSFFDHEYPLLFTEPASAKGKTLPYTGIRENEQIKPYSGHNGYDYPLHNGTPVLAADSGIASYKKDDGGGETIVINHGNEFFTWYMHLQRASLIVDRPGETINVTKGQRIGFSGNTGNNTTGPHLHISVIKDLNNNGILDFGIDYPNGLVDPYGWQPNSVSDIQDDPWLALGGSKSHYLWINPLTPITSQISATGSSLAVGQANIVFPDDSSRPNLNLSIDEQPASNALQNLKGASHTFDIKASDTSGNLISTFTKPFELIINYGKSDITNIKEDTISLHWFNPESQTWEKIPTTLDTTEKTASAQLSHMSLFVLMGEIKDLTSPTTAIELLGAEGKDGWFRSDVTVALNATDNPSGVGINQTYFSIGNNIDWELYEQPLTFTEEGTYTTYTHSIDKGGNVETPHSLTFTIDKTPPEAKIQFNPDTLDTEIIGLDNNESTEVFLEDTNRKTQKLTIKDKAGNTLTIIGKDKEKGKNTNITIATLSYNNGPPTEFDRNRLFIEFNLDKKEDDLKTLIQSWFVKGDIKIRIVYKKKTNQSTIFIKEQRQERQKETKEGLILLQIRTNQGKLEYSY